MSSESEVKIEQHKYICVVKCHNITDFYVYHKKWFDNLKPNNFREYEKNIDDNMIKNFKKYVK
jgi:hypothetical protein